MFFSGSTFPERSRLGAYFEKLVGATATREGLARMLARKPRMLVIVALANKMARIVWALLAKGGVYKSSSALA